MGVFFFICLSLFLFFCLLMTTIILLQEGKTLGLGASFGGDAGNSVFGTSTADVLKTITAWMIGVFMFFSLFLSVWSSAAPKKAVEAHQTVTEKTE